MRARPTRLASTLGVTLFCALCLALTALADRGGSAQPAPTQAPIDGGTQVAVQVADGGDTTIAVHSGELRVKAGGKEEHVASGQGVQVKKGQAPKKTLLLPAPMVVAPADGQRIGKVDVSLGWQEVRGAQGYHLAISSDPRFDLFVHDQLHPSSVRASVRLDAGTYYWRVSAVDAVGLEGQPSPARKFVVDLTPPTLKTGKPQWR
jgi:hypothetical protein